MNKEIQWHNITFEEAIKKLNSDFERGLTEEEVEIRQRQFGKNLLPEEKPLPKTKIFFRQFKSPLIYILIIAGFVTLILRDFTDAIVIFGVVFLNTIIGFFQENKTSNILAALKKVVKVDAFVIRQGNEKEIRQGELVPGDIVLLNPGNKVPADGRLIWSHNLKINEAALTGEWLANKKDPKILKQETSLADRDNMVYMGTVVEEGIGRVIVTETGLQTEIGKVVEMVKEAKEEKTPFQKKVARFSVVLGLIIVFLCLFIFIFGVLTGKGYLEMLLTGIAVAVAAIPEGLPVAVTVTFAFGLQRILKKKGLVRKIVAAVVPGKHGVILCAFNRKYY
ncbi:HAD-IC family P-type ATPase [Patescibacteria group bacterium]|nr:HAD-IC family P-type ATPase [Patescibacteria group bacterium]